MLRDELRAVGALLLTRRGEVDNLPRRMERFLFLAGLFGLARLLLLLEIGDDLPGRVVVDHADVDRRTLVAAGEPARQLSAARRIQVEADSDEQHNLGVQERRDAEPEANPTAPASATAGVRIPPACSPLAGFRIALADYAHLAASPSVSNLAPPWREYSWI